MSGRLSKLALGAIVIFLSGAIESRPQDRTDIWYSQRLDPQTFSDRVRETALGQIYLSHLALERSSNERVRTFATKAITDNMVMAERIQTIAAQNLLQKGSTVEIQRSKPGLAASIEPATVEMSKLSSRHKEMGERLWRLTGTEFDHEYLRMAIDDNHMLIEDFKLAPSGKVYDVLPRDPAGRPTVRSSPRNVEPETTGEYRPEADFAREMLPTVWQNMAEANRILADL